MIRLLHTADIHLDSPLKSLALRDAALRDRVRTATRAALERIVDIALDREVHALLIAGDLFDGAERSARTAAFLTGQLDRLREAGIRAFYIKGNHDAANPVAGEPGLPDNTHIFGGRGGRIRLTDTVWIHGVSFAGRQAHHSLLPKFSAPVDGAVNIGMLHTSLAGAEGHDPYAPCTVADLVAHGFDYWALGHVHRRQVHSENPWIVMPGTPQGRDIGDAGPKSATLVTIHDRHPDRHHDQPDRHHRITVEAVPTAGLEFHTASIPAAETGDALRDRMRHSLRTTADSMTASCGVVRVTLTGDATRHWPLLRDREVWSETAADLARETGRLWLDKLDIDLADDRATGEAATDELARIMAAIRREPAFATLCRDRLQDLLQELPPPRRATLAPDTGALDRLGGRLAETGARRVLARMKGAGD